MSKIKLTFADSVMEEYKWFAWYPIRTVDRGWRWLQPVYKRKYTLHDYLNAPVEDFFMYSVEEEILG